ncbi:hypothetical protein JCM8097_002483 [Rhodosporidiobolus ruineniae]
MRVLGLLSLVCAGYAALCAAYSSPPIAASIASSWPAPALVTQYLETLALEAPDELFPFLDFLSTHPNLHLSLKTPLLPSSLSIARRYAAAGLNPVFAPETAGLIQPNETLALLETAATKSRLLRSRGLRESLMLALANREASVRIEGMRGLWEEREKEVGGWAQAQEAVAAVAAAADDDVHVAEVVEDEARKAKKAERAMPEVCESWIDVGGQKACTEQDFWTIVGQEQQTEKTPIKLPNGLPSPDRPPIFPIDHVTPRGENAHLPRFVLYGSPTHASFQTLFTFVYSLSNPKAVPIAHPNSATPGLVTSKSMAVPHPPRLQFILRWKPSTVEGAAEQPKLVLSGYGATLDIKKSDYLAIDDRLQNGETGGAAAVNQEEPVLGIEGDVAPRMEPVRKSDVPELALRSAQFILNSAEPFKAFTTLTSAFPRLASRLSTLVPSPDPHLLSEVSMNQMDVPMLTMRPSFFLNGLALSEADIDPYALLRLMRKERKYLADVTSLNVHMTGKDARDILIDGSPKSKAGSARNGIVDAEALGELYDATDRQEGSEVILWWNDLEKDRRYKSWSKSVRDLLRPTYPGALPSIAKNLNNVVFVLDLSQPNAIHLVTESVKHFISRAIPVRFGVVPLVGEFEDQTQTQVAQVLWYLVDALGRTPAMSFLSDLYAASPEAQITEDLLRRLYSRLAESNQHVDGGALAGYDEVQAGVGKRATASHSRLSKTRQYLRRLGVPLAEDGVKEKSLGSFLMNGAFFPIDEDFTQNLQRTLGLHIQFLQQEAYYNKLTDETDAKAYFADLPSTHKRRNPYIFPSLETNPLRFANLLDAYEGIDPAYVNRGWIQGVNGKVNETTGYDVEDPPAPVSILVVTDLNSPEGAQLARAALKLADKTTRVRLLLLHNPPEHDEEHPWALSNILYLLHEYNSFPDVLPIELINWIDLDIGPDGPDKQDGRNWSEENPLKGALDGGVDPPRQVQAQIFWETMDYLRYKLGYQPGQNGVVMNGRIVGPFPDGAFELPDLQSLLDYELDKRIDSVVAAVNGTSLPLELLERSQLSHLIEVASSIVGLASLPDPAAGMFGGGPAERRRDYMHLTGNHSAIIDKHETGAFYEIAVVVDPATETAQRWAPIIETLSMLVFVHVRLYLNPAFHLDDIPIKRFYEHSFRPTLEFDEATGVEVQPGVRFNNVPEDLLLTFGADVPKAWLAFPKKSIHDLDNIRLADLSAADKGKGVEAVLELEALVVEGHARDMPSSKPPRGLELELRSGAKEKEDATRVDTIVMANLGYFQFKANPGLWRLDIRSSTRSAEVFELESVGADGWKSPSVARAGNTLAVTTLEGLTLYPRFVRKPGHELTELLDESAAAASSKKQSGGFVERLKNMIPFFAPSPTELITTTKRAEVNIFTVASGLLYERMAFIMMVSVMRHTKSTVKFWFIANFLSPSFKAFIPHLAEEYGFQYELVTYKWPHWLRAQKEKQRTIWGYKILFLDVLFPLDLDRVIFVDSDQIVRTDLKELVDMDIKGAPYAYAPMGDSREEMEGFRFWKTGYWQQHLQGKPYHISALYLVDLVRFRQIAAGDRLRQAYQGLSADPNSLANLDQDLPNSSQFTLDPSWLYCETWCSDEDFAKAKTIDLCNNPLTKEPKLKRARRAIPEWSVYDDEVAALARRVAATSSDASAFATRADELGQAKEQQKEREELVKEKKEKGADGDEIVEEGERVKDEL